MTAVQGAAMMLFNSLKELDVKGMAEKLNIDVDIVVANVEPLAQRRQNSLLRKKARGERSCTCETQYVCDNFVLNERFYIDLSVSTKFSLGSHEDTCVGWPSHWTRN